MIRSYVAAIILLAVVAIVYVGCVNGNSALQEGNYVAEGGKEWLSVSNGVVRIGRDKSSFSVLPNKTNEKLFDKNDLSFAHPQYLRSVEDNMVEWVREASGPSPQYKIIFRRK